MARGWLSTFGLVTLQARSIPSSCELGVVAMVLFCVHMYVYVIGHQVMQAQNVRTSATTSTKNCQQFVVTKWVFCLFCCFCGLCGDGVNFWWKVLCNRLTVILADRFWGEHFVRQCFHIYWLFGGSPRVSFRRRPVLLSSRRFGELPFDWRPDRWRLHSLVLGCSKKKIKGCDN